MWYFKMKLYLKSIKKIEYVEKIKFDKVDELGKILGVKYDLNEEEEFVFEEIVILNDIILSNVFFEVEGLI